ncbi:hypothetical protein OUZ56_010161 [Daphnia magna]|uniref:Uncharacterized protein n=1 Tax=Daphnia magna TaxID=35525 RepID=A0ABR0AHZ3_9CRUS|nr:hypothetical protein OUZ56_010161 [Daphnia magna]
MGSEKKPDSVSTIVITLRDRYTIPPTTESTDDPFARLSNLLNVDSLDQFPAFKIASTDNPLAVAFEAAALLVECAPNVSVSTPTHLKEVFIQRLTELGVTGLCGAITAMTSLSLLVADRNFCVRST